MASHDTLQEPSAAAEPEPAPLAPPASTTAPALDSEAEKRKQRAARFGIPVVEPPKPRPPQAARNPSARNGAKAKQPQPANATADVRTFTR